MQANNTVKAHGYFTMPNEIYQLNLSAGAIVTYGFLSSLENRKRGDKDHYSCHPSYRTIGNAIGRSSRSVAKYVQELVEAGLPTKVTTKDGKRWNGSLKYRLLSVKNAVSLFHERQLAELEDGVQKKRKVMDAAERTRKRKQVPHADYIAARSKHEPEVLPL